MSVKKMVVLLGLVFVLLSSEELAFAELPNDGEQNMDISRIESGSDAPVVEEKTVLEEKGIVLFEEEQTAALEAQKQAEEAEAEALAGTLFQQEESVSSYGEVSLPATLFTDEETSHLAASEETEAEDESLRYGLIGGAAALLGSVIYLFRGTFE